MAAHLHVLQHRELGTPEDFAAQNGLCRCKGVSPAQWWERSVSEKQPNPHHRHARPGVKKRAGRRGEPE